MKDAATTIIKPKLMMPWKENQYGFISRAMYGTSSSEIIRLEGHEWYWNAQVETLEPYHHNAFSEGPASSVDQAKQNIERIFAKSGYRFIDQRLANFL